MQSSSLTRRGRLSSFEKRYPAYIGYVYAILCNFISVFGNFFIQNISKNFTHNQTFHFVGIQLVLYNYGAIHYQKLSSCPKNPRITKMLCLRAMTGMVAGIFFYAGLPLVPLSEGTVIQMSTPVITGILAIGFLSEKYDRTLLITTILSVAGVLLITKPSFLFGEVSSGADYPSRDLGLILLLICAFITSLSQILLRKLGSVSNAYTTALFLGIGFCLSASIMEVIQGVKGPGLEKYFWVLLLGLLRFVTHVLNNKSYAFGEAGKISLISYSQVPIAYLVDLIIVGIEPEFFSIVGSVCVFSSVFVMLAKQYKKQQTSAK